MFTTTRRIALALVASAAFASSALAQTPPTPTPLTSSPLIQWVELKTGIITAKELIFPPGAFLIVTPSEDMEVLAGTMVDDEKTVEETTLTGGEEFEITLTANLTLPKGSKLAKKSKIPKSVWDQLNKIKFGKTTYLPSAPVKAVDVDRSMRSVNQKLDAISEAVDGLSEKVESLDKRVGALEARPVAVRVPPPTSPETARPLPPPPAAAVIYNVDSCGRRIYSSDGGRNWYYCP